MKLPPNFEQWNPAMRGAYMKGGRARQAGEPIGACPYEDKRNVHGRLTWSRAFSSAWCDGWRDADKDAHITEFYNDRASSGLGALAK